MRFSLQPQVTGRRGGSLIFVFGFNIDAASWEKKKKLLER